MATYHDGHIDLVDNTLSIKRYYFPSAAAKHIPIATIDNVLMVHLGVLGKLRLWGAGDGNLNIKHWYSQDLKRPTKQWALIITITGSQTQPTITPDDPEALVKALTAAGVNVTKNPEQRKIVTGPRHGDQAAEDHAVLLPEYEDEVKSGHDVPLDEK